MYLGGLPSGTLSSRAREGGNAVMDAAGRTAPRRPAAGERVFSLALSPSVNNNAQRLCPSVAHGSRPGFGRRLQPG